MAAPAPWANRAAMSIPGPVASPHASEARVNTAMPARNMRLRPTRSPSRPLSSSRPPNAMRNEFITQLRLPAVKPRSAWILGSATVTIVPSRMIISDAVHKTTSASQRLRATGPPRSRSHPLGRP